jgi:hypothetical protein
MRPFIWFSVSCVVAAGCDFGKESLLSVLVVDRAELAPIDRSGRNWCRYGEAPFVGVTVGFGGLVTMTPLSQSAMPVWRAPTIIAPDEAWRRGIYVEARGECDGDRFAIGAVIVHPSLSAVERGGLLLRNVGGLRSLRLHFAHNFSFDDGDGDVAWYAYAVSAGAYVNGDASGWPVYDDGSDAWDDGNYGDSVSYGDAAGADNGAGAAGDGWGGDPGGDYGGDSGGDGEARRPSAPPTSTTRRR